ncbi:MAG: protease pro-enzyme activation domain-containing protein [Sulfuricaulis sp.]
MDTGIGEDAAFVGAMTMHNRLLQHIRHARLALVLALSGAALCQVFPAHAQSPWVNVDTRAHPTGKAVFHGYLPENESLDVVVALKLRNRDQLDYHVRALTQPGNPEFRRWLNREQILTDYAPLPERADAVAAYLTQAGFTNVRIEANRLLVTATGTTAAIRRAFHTELGRFVRDGREGIANVTNVQVPPELGDTVLSVLGLQTLDQMHTMNYRIDGVLLSGSVHGLNPVMFPTVYDAAGLPTASTTAVGIITEGNMTQTITDLHQFESQNGLPTINPAVVLVGPPSKDTSNTAEWDLDSQNIQAMAGGQVAQMIFYTAYSLSNSYITKALNKAVSDNVVAVINVSLGECESAAYSDGSMAADDQIFQLAIAQGQTFSISSGDSGSNECGSPQGTSPGASYPASSPYVMAVGGTTLYTDSNGNYGGETAWSGTGGSPSLYEPKPIWQSGVVSGSYRGVPDIAFDADPYSGAIIVVNGALAQYGGTSLASPLFVGSWARIQSANNARLGFPASWIYSRGAQNTPAFHDVTSGTNGGYSAATGWDYTTGFGSFDVAATALLTRSTVTVSASPKSVIAGQPVTFTATVTGNSPTGTVQFLVNGVNFGSPVQLVNGVATLTTSQLTVTGTDSITAVYSGDANNAGSSTVTAFSEIVTLGHDGDINGDGVVDAADVLLAQRIALGLITPTVSQLAHGDVAPGGGDGVIDADDVSLIQGRALGLVSF